MCSSCRRIFCGNAEEALREGWKGVRAGEGGPYWLGICWKCDRERRANDTPTEFEQFAATTRDFLKNFGM